MTNDERPRMTARPTTTNRHWGGVVLWSSVLAFLVLLSASPTAADPKPVPRVQAVPEPYDQISFQVDGKELTRAHFGPSLKRPFLYPIVGPAGKALTRMGHPRDPVSHSHHNSVWIAHHDINGVDSWADTTKGRIVHQKIEKLVDGPDAASATTLNAWIDDAANSTLMLERRRITVKPFADGEWLLLLDLQFEPKVNVTIGKTPFGFAAVRMAKSIGVTDGGGTIRNSEGQVDEKEVFWKQAKWVDYSGAIADGVLEGVTLFDHPGNPNHPSNFHVRNDGWMGASFSHRAAAELPIGKSLRLRYGVYVHKGQPTLAAIEEKWRPFAAETLDDLTPAKKK